MDNPFDIIQMRFDSLEKRISVLTDMLLVQNSATSTAPIQDDQEFSITELAVYLRKTKATIQRYKRNQVLPFHQAGRTVFFKKSEVDAAMSSLPAKKKGAKPYG
jgi:excisionase family DNA binding protein